MLWLFKRTISMRRLFWASWLFKRTISMGRLFRASKTQCDTFANVYKSFYIFTLKFFAYLDQFKTLSKPNLEGLKKGNIKQCYLFTNPLWLSVSSHICWCYYGVKISPVQALWTTTWNRWKYFRRKSSIKYRKLVYRTLVKSAHKKMISLFLNQNICCGYSKEPSHWDGSFEHPKHMLKRMGKKIFTILRSKMLFI